VADITVVGLHGGEWFGRGAEAALRRADVLIGAARHLDALPANLSGERVVLTSPDEVLERATEVRARGRRVCVLASGDPGFFGLVRLASARFGPAHLEIHPAPSAVALAFARLGVSWDDATVVSAHGRPVEHAVEAVLACPKVAVLMSPDGPPEALGGALLAAGLRERAVAVCSRLGEPGEAVTRTDVDGLAGDSFDPLSVVVLMAPGGGDGRADQGMGVAWGLPDARYAHRDGMVTKAEVRAVALGKLGLPPTGVLWDVGAGSGSVAVECARLAPGLQVFAIERRPEDLERLRTNAAGTAVRAIAGDAPAILTELPDPDRAFVGGGGLGVLDAVLARLRPGGRVVSTYAALDRAAAGATRLGHMVQVAVSRGMPIGDDGSIRLEAENPVFVCWGPDE
jgi:precorrin-6Y C5,15-methyltransferase (decarboxylating)